MSRSSVCVNFIELLYSLGWPVRVEKHVGWTGHSSTSFKLSCENITVTDVERDQEILFVQIHITDENESRTEKSRPSFDSTAEEDSDDGVCLYDGSESVLYWCDALSEIAFVVPSLRQSYNESNISKSFDILQQIKFINQFCNIAMKLQVAGANIEIV